MKVHVISIISLLSLLYSGCGSDNYGISLNKRDLASTSQVDNDDENLIPPALGDVVEEPTPVPVPLPLPLPMPAPGPDYLITSCAAAKNIGKLVTKRVEISFEDPGQVCAWGKDDNLSTLNGYIRARTEQIKSLELVPNSTVCAINMTNLDEQNFLYDDNIFITLNDFVLSSTSNFSQHLDKSYNGFYKYDWKKLVDKNAQNSKSDSTADKQYCAGSELGLASCLFPQTETTGKVELQFSDVVIQNILGITSSSNIKLGVITTGDNDSTDCQHVPLRFAVDVQYYLNN